MESKDATKEIAVVIGHTAGTVTTMEITMEITAECADIKVNVEETIAPSNTWSQIF